ncbi:MAG: methyltransferase domain-containing protein [Mycobacteriales bacterium]
MEIADVAALRSTEGRAVLAEIGPYDSAEAIRVAATLRSAGHPADLVATALTQARLRGRAAAKFGPDAERMLFTPDGLEQATRAVVAEHRAARFAAAGRTSVADLCCGIGGDLVALARAGADVHGVEIDPVTAAVAGANAEELGLAERARVSPADATAQDIGSYDAVFLDPSRRSGGRRVFNPDAYAPPWSFVTRVLGGDACVKVAPGIPHDRIPPGVEAEWVSDAGDVKEAALWGGALRSTDRRATLLPGGATLVGADLDRPPVRPPGRWLYEPDGAVIRAHLVAAAAAEVDGALLDPTIAYFSADTYQATAFATAYEVTDVMRFSVKRLRELLRQRGVGIVTVKKRGSPVEPETLRQQLRLTGSAHVVVVVTRVAGTPTVLVCQPPAPPQPVG